MRLYLWKAILSSTRFSGLIIGDVDMVEAYSTADDFVGVPTDLSGRVGASLFSRELNADFAGASISDFLNYYD